MGKILDALPKGRMLSLDVFRGITITMMIFVNNPGSWSYMYPPLKHAEWNGWTPTDFIFPFFVFIMGGMVYCVPIDLTWQLIGKGPAILLGAVCLWIYSTIFAACLVQGVSTCPKCGDEKDETL